MHSSRENNYLGLSGTQAQLLQNLNGQFLSQHDKTAHSALDQIDTVITFTDGHLRCFQKDEKQNAYIKVADEVVAPIFGPYTQVKEISHIPLLILETLHDNKITDQEKKEKLFLISQHLANINKGILPTNETNRHQKAILAHSIEFLSTLSGFHPLNLEHKLAIYMQKLKPSLDYNMRFVTQIQLNALQQIMSKWGHALHLNLNKSRFIVVGAHGPREGLIETQYFIDLYNKIGVPHAENKHVYFVEQLPQHFGLIKIEKDLIENFLAVSERNKVIGQVFGNNQKFMFKDVLADSAPPVLAKLSPPAFFSPTKKISGCPIMQSKPTAEVRSRL